MALNDIKVPKENAQGTFNEIALAASDLKLGTTANLPLRTGSGGVVEAGSFGTAAGSFCAGDDVRLSDDRDPNLHAASHAAGGSDPVTLDPSQVVSLGGVGDVWGSNESLSDVFNVFGNIVSKDQSDYATSGSITTSGLTQSTARILGRTTASTGAVEEIQIGSGLSLSAGELSATGSGVTAVGASTADVLSVSGSDLVADDAGADRIIFWDDSESKLRYLEAGSGLSISGTTMTASGGIGGGTGSTDNSILRSDGTGGSTLQASGLVIEDTVTAFTTITGDAGTDIITATGSAFANGQRVRFTSLTGGAGLNTTTNYFVINVSGETFQLSTTSGGSASLFTTNITAGTLLTGHALQPLVQLSNVASDTNSALVLCHKGTGPFVVSPAPIDGTTSGGNLRGAEAVCIVPARNAATQVASGLNSVAIGARATASGQACVSLGSGCSASIADSTAIGNSSTASSNGAVAIGWLNTASGRGSVAVGGLQNTANLRAQFLTPPFSAVYWGGQTANATPLILNLDATATNRFTIAASTALAVDILLVARRSDTQDKWLVARRFLGIRRDGSNNTSLIGTVQTLGTDQSAGSPSWTFALTADDANEALQLEVTGAASETVEWRATAFYRVA